MQFNQQYPNYQQFSNNQLYPQYYQPQQAAQPIQQPPVQANNDFVVVSSEDDVLKWAVAPGSVVTFKIENQPVIIEKSMGYSKFESPRYDRYRMVKEDMVTDLQKPKSVDLTRYDEKIDALTKEVADLKNQIGELTARKVGRPKKEETDE